MPLAMAPQSAPRGTSSVLCLFLPCQTGGETGLFIPNTVAHEVITKTAICKAEKEDLSETGSVGSLFLEFPIARTMRNLVGL